ncbi:hypothetical protein ACFQ71_12345 [Streptomyces sp. NPDC056534]|uniref:hypothetical protein n=1 Tax=Streptomyces sp. NPDC056534 TaxID=3345857 RepID=UPI003696AFC6
MTADDEHRDDPEHLRRPPARVLSANQLVSYNLMRARREADWSQTEVAELLEKYTARGWSNASVSAAERAWQGGRPRRFDASEIVAFSRMFDQPIAYFFMPPEKERYWSKWVGMREFNDGIPDASSVEDAMSLVATDELVRSLSMGSVSQRFELRMSELTLAWLGLTWDGPELKSPIRVRTDELWYEQQTRGVDWADVVEAREAAEEGGQEGGQGDALKFLVTPEEIAQTLDQIMGDVKQSVIRRLLAREGSEGPVDVPPEVRPSNPPKMDENAQRKQTASKEEGRRIGRRLLDGPAGGS